VRKRKKKKKKKKMVYFKCDWIWWCFTHL